MSIYAPSTCGHCKRSATKTACGRTGPSHDAGGAAAGLLVPPAPVTVVETEVEVPVPALESRGAGEWTVVTDPPTVEGNMVRIRISGHPHLNARADVLVEVYESPSDLDDTLQGLVAARGKATVLVATENMYGAPHVAVYSGTLFESGSGAVGILPGRSRRNGKLVSGRSTRVLDVIPGATPKAAEELNRRFHSAPVPELEPVTPERLRDASPEHPVAVLGTHPGFGGGPAAGSVWVVDHYDEENDIVEGYLWMPEGSDGVSEHGSIYGRDLRRAGIVKGNVNVTADEAFDLPEDRTSAYRALFG